MRSIFGTFLVLAIATAASAQTAPAQIMLNNAPAGINIDVFIDAGKVQTVAVNQQGTAGFDLDFLSLGKPQGQVYIETCKDGQRIRVVTDGTTVPADESCNRKPVGVPFTFTCTKKITINFATARGSFAGCGTILTNKYFWGGVGGALVGVGIGVGGGSQPSTTHSSFDIPANNSTNVATPQTPAAPTQPQPTAPAVGNPAGTHVVATCTVGSDPAQHEAVLRFCSQVRQLAVSASNGGMSVTATTLWIIVQGSYNTATGAFSYSTSGALPGTSFTGVAFSFVGTIDANGNMQGTVTIGGAGLPGGQAVAYAITTRKG